MFEVETQKRLSRRDVLASASAFALTPVIGPREETEMQNSVETKQRETVFDVVVIGGSFAGLSAATQLGRARRSVLVIDDGQPRNRFAPHSHGFLTQDGHRPADILATARKQLRRYPTVRLIEGRANSVARGERFAINTSAGRFESRRVVLAYGMRDVLPDLAGLRELWGKSVFHCPYCHAYELRDRPLGILANGKAAMHGAMLLPDWSRDVILFTNGPAEFDEAERARLARRGVKIEEGRIARLVAEGEQLAAVELTDGRRVPRVGLLLPQNIAPASDLHAQLGCGMDEGPAGSFVRVDEKKATTVPGVCAVGDLVRMAGNVALAVADGSMAAAMTHQSLLAEDWA